MPAWPLTLPQNFLLGSTEQRRTAIARFSTDSGLVKRRRVFGNAPRDFSVPLYMTVAQKITFDQFFIETLVEGSLDFTWTDPDSGITKNFVFAEYPQFTRLTPDLYQTNLALEILA